MRKIITLISLCLATILTACGSGGGGGGSSPSGGGGGGSTTLQWTQTSPTQWQAEINPILFMPNEFNIESYKYRYPLRLDGFTITEQTNNAGENKYYLSFPDLEFNTLDEAKNKAQETYNLYYATYPKQPDLQWGADNKATGSDNCKYALFTYPQQSDFYVKYDMDTTYLLHEKTESQAKAYTQRLVEYHAYKNYKCPS